MLKFFRRRDTVTRFILGGFLVVICIAMVWFLIPQGAANNSTAPINEQTVATVNGVTITGQDVSDTLAQMEDGQSIPAELLPLLGQQIVRNLVVEQALEGQAQKLGLEPTTQEIVAAARAAAPVLYPNGKYVGDTQAAQLLASQNMTLNEFQDRLRQNLITTKMMDLVTGSVRVSDAAVHREFEQENEKAVFSYVLLNPTDLQSQVKVTPKALAAYYAQHQSTYNSPERRQLDVILANLTQIGAQIQISNSAVDQYYQQHLADYTHPEEVKVSHILIKYPDANPTPAEIAATKKRAEVVLKKVQADPKNFANLAKQYSEDDASASNGGELGYIQRNQTVPNFEKVAFSLPVGQISGLVQTEYGFHIIKVEDHKQASVQSEAEVHDQIVSQLRQDQAANRAQQLMSQAESMAATTPLSQVAQQLKLQYFTTAPLSRTDPITGIGVNPDFASAVFAAAPGGVTPSVQVAQGYALAKVVRVVPPGPQPLSAVQDEVTADYKTAQAKQMAKDEANALHNAAVKSGLKAAAAAMHLSVKTSTPLTRSGSLPDTGAISSFADTLFGLKPGQVGPVTTANGGQLVYALDSLQQPTEADFQQQRAKIESNLLTNRRNNVFGAYTDALVASLTKAGKVTIDQAALQRVLSDESGSPAPASNPIPQPLGNG